jgi:hypothetical protein
MTLRWSCPEELRPLLPAIDAEIRAWAGTRYMSGQQVKGVHADCVRSGTGIIDGLYGYRRTLPRNIALDACQHAPEAARAQFRLLLSIYPEARLLPLNPLGDYDVQPADLVVVGPRAGGPGHLIIVGAEVNTAWEAPSVGQCFRKIGIGLSAGQHVKHVLRMSDRLSWGSGLR